MSEEYSDYRYIPDDIGSKTSSGLSVDTFRETVSVNVDSPHDTISSSITLTVNDAKWLRKQLKRAVDTITLNALESEATE